MLVKVYDISNVECDDTPIHYEWEGPIPVPFTQFDRIDVLPPEIENLFDAKWHGGNDSLWPTLADIATRYGIDDIPHLAFLLGVDHFYEDREDIYVFPYTAEEVQSAYIDSLLAGFNIDKAPPAANVYVQVADAYPDEDIREQAFEGLRGSYDTLDAYSDMYDFDMDTARNEEFGGEMSDRPEMIAPVPFPISVDRARTHDEDGFEYSERLSLKWGFIVAMRNLAREWNGPSHRLQIVYNRAKSPAVQHYFALREATRHHNEDSNKTNPVLQAMYAMEQYAELLDVWRNNGQTNDLDSVDYTLLHDPETAPFWSAVLNAENSEAFEYDLDCMMDLSMASGNNARVPEEVVAWPFIQKFEEELAQQAIERAAKPMTDFYMTTTFKNGVANTIHVVDPTKPVCRSLAFSDAYRIAMDEGNTHIGGITRGYYAYAVSLGFQGNIVDFWKLGTTDPYAKAKDGHRTVNFGRALKRCAECLQQIPAAKAAYLEWKAAMNPTASTSAYWRARGRALRYVSYSGDRNFHEELMSGRVNVRNAKQATIRMAVDPAVPMDTAAMRERMLEAMDAARVSMLDDVTWIATDSAIRMNADRFGHTMLAPVTNQKLDKRIPVFTVATGDMMDARLLNWTVQHNATVIL